MHEEQGPFEEPENREEVDGKSDRHDSDAKICGKFTDYVILKLGKRKDTSCYTSSHALDHSQEGSMSVSWTGFEKQYSCLNRAVTSRELGSTVLQHGGLHELSIFPSRSTIKPPKLTYPPQTLAYFPQGVHLNARGMATSGKDLPPPLSLTIAVLTSLRNTSPTPSQDTLLVELQKLELVLFRTKLLDHSVHCTQVTTLKEAAIYCRDAIIEFWERKILKGDGGMGEHDWRMIGSWQDINWDTCDEGDLASLEVELLRYRERVEASMANSDGQSASPTTRSATRGILLSSQEELERRHGAQGVEGWLPDSQIEGPIEDNADAKLDLPEGVSAADSTPQEPHDGS